MAPSTILLQSGTVLQHDDQDNVHVLRDTDILIEGNRIAQIGRNLTTHETTTVIDCRNKIVSPGLIDAHHHLWQTQLKGRFGNLTLLEYAASANLQSINFTSDDMFWGQLGGCLEALDAGTTCVIDNAHMSSGPEHGSAALSATIASGMRAIFCYGVSPVRAQEWTQTTFELDMGSPFPDWLGSQMEDFARRAPFGDDGQVQLGFFFDSYFIPQPKVVEIFEQMRKLGVKMITSHFRHWPISEGQSKIPELLKSSSLLGPDILLSHGNGATADQASVLTSAGVYIASTPDAEIFLASGADPIAFRADLPLTCLGADCHSCGPASMLHQMQMAVGSDRATQTSAAFAGGRYPREFKAKAQDAFNLATIKAARAARMDSDIGSIAVGKLADLVLFDATTPTMTCAFDHDPLVAVVRHAGVKEIDTVIVGGQILKQHGILQNVNVARGLKHGQFSLASTVLPTDGVLGWTDISKKLSVSRSEIQERIEMVNLDLAKENLMAVMGGLKDVLA